MGQVRHAGRRDTTTAKHPAGRRGWASPAGSLCRNGSSAEGGADEPLTNVLLLEGQTGWRNALSACSAISRVLLVPRPERIRHRAPFGLRPSVPCGSRPSAVLGGDTDFERRATEAAAAVRGVAELEPPRLPARERPRLATVGATDGGKTTLSLEEVNVAIGGLPIWEAGHEFLSWEPRLRAATAHSPHVVTFGLVLPQLAALSTRDGVRRVAERWGLEHLADLARRYRNARGVPGEPALADLAVRLNQQVDFPELDPATAEPLPVEMPPEHEMTAVFEEFAAADGKGIVEWLGITSFATPPLAPTERLAGGLLGGYLRLMRDAADTRARYEPDGLGDLVRNFYDTLDVRHGLRAVYDASGREQWVPTYRDLAERAALELEHLLTFAPRLSRCRLCNRVFVARSGKRPEVHCRQYLWLASPPRRFLERCVPPSSEERKRKRKRLHQQYRRTLAKHGGDRRHPDVQQALKKYADDVRSEPSSPPGRRPVPRPGFVAKDDQLAGGTLVADRRAVLKCPSRLEHDLEGKNDAADYEAGEYRQHERPSSHSNEPSGKTRPERERECLHPDHRTDGILE